MIHQFNMFATIMEHWILAECNGRLVVDLQIKYSGFLVLQFYKLPGQPYLQARGCVPATYYASHEDKATIFFSQTAR
jgi:hypothetical protein